MVVIHKGRMRRKTTGGRYKAYRGKRTFERGRPPILTTIGKENVVKKVRMKAGSRKAKLAIAKTVNLYDPKSKTFVQAKVTSVTDNPASRHFVRQNVMTKGAIIVTEKGKARVTSRPGQHGSVNAVLM